MCNMGRMIWGGTSFTAARYRWPPNSRALERSTLLVRYKVIDNEWKLMQWK